MHDKSEVMRGTGASFAAVAAVVGVLLATGTAYAVPLAGIGGFTIQAEEIRGQEAYIYAGGTDSSERSAIPAGVTELASSEIDGLKLIKKLDVGSIPGLSGQMKMVISGTDTVTTGPQMLKFSNLKADEAILRSQVIDESASDDPNEQFTIEARGDPQEAESINLQNSGDKPGLVLKDVTINAHYLATNRISIPGQQISIAYDPDGDGTFEQQFGS